MARPVGGLATFLVNGKRYLAKGSFTYNPGFDKRDAVVGADTVHGFKVARQVPFIEGAITDDGTLNLAELMNAKDAQVVIQLENGRTISLNDAWFAGEGSVTTEEGEIAVRFEGRTFADVTT